MDQTKVFQRRQLQACTHGDLRILDTLRWATPFGSSLRIYLGRNADTEAIKPVDAADVRLTDRLRIVGNTVITGTVAGGVRAVEFATGQGKLTLPTSMPETGLFADMNVMLALRHTETVAQVADWLRYHTDHHGLEGAVLLDRAGPGAAREGFAKDLEVVVAGIPALRRLVLVSADLPLGGADLPALGDPASAPRAKDRRFTPDPWLALLNEPILYDILKWRFLTRAGAVIALDPCDMLRMPGDGVNAFEACRQSHTGLMRVQGASVYPWRVRKGHDPQLGDHICRANPQNDAPQRWAVAPKRIVVGPCWLPNVISGASGLADEVLDYDRAVSVLYSKAEVSTLINKDVLELDNALLDRARDAFGHAPIQPPARKPAQARPVMAAPSGRTAIVTCMKNEGPFLLEWLAYHRMIGVDDFLVYTNDCDDGTDTLLDVLQDRGLVQRRDNPFRGTDQRPQQAALQAAWSDPVVQNAGWLISMDVDEFLNVHAGANRLPDLFAAIGDANMVSATWRLFGNDDVEAYEDRPIIEQFTRCAPQLIRRPHQAWGFKTLFRNQGLWEGFGVHRPRGHLGGEVNWVNGSGYPMPERLIKTGWRSSLESYGYDLVTLNHYAVRSVESFLVKRDRGRVNHVTRDQGAAYWFRMNNNDQQDLSIHRHLPELNAELDKLKADPEIAALHAQAVAAHRAKVVNLMEQDEYVALHDRLCGDKMKRLSRMHRHFGMNVFLHGPSVVPDRVFQPDLPESFFFNTAHPDS